MPPLPAALISVSIVMQALGTAVAHAASYPVSGFSFGLDPINLSISPLTFPSAALSFSSAPIQTETASAIEVTLPADILFDFDKAEIRPDAQNPLHELAELLRAKAHGSVMIQGYTDALGSDNHNQVLSERRAAAVKTWLATREGLRSMPFKTVGFGPRNPVAPNRRTDGSDDPEGRQLNRRVTLIISR